jgi:hypothetical protein
VAVTLASCQVAPPAEVASKRPNILLFFVDDLGWQDLSEPFHTRRQTSSACAETV